MKKTIITEFFTTVSAKHFWTSLSYLTIRFPGLRSGPFVKEAQRKMLKYIGNEESSIVSFYNGRTALYKVLRAVLTSGNNHHEVMVNSYNCVSVINSIIQAGATPIYVDIDEDTLSFNTEDLKKKITSHTKVIILQHTFGKTGKIEEIQKIAQENHVILIEDVAHSLGSKYDNKAHGTFGDLSFFSTGRDKVISGVNGGFLLINNPKLYRITTELEDFSLEVPKKLIAKNLFYNVSGFLSLKLYDFFSIGKGIIHFSRKFGLINEIVTKKEKECQYKDLLYKLPNSLARLTINDLKNINKYIEHRRKIAKLYDKNLNSKYFKIAFNEEKKEEINYFRYPIIFDTEQNAKKFFEYMKKNNILLGNSWSGINIAPKGTDLNKCLYNFDCPIAESISKRILLLPNSKFTTVEDAKKVIKLSNNFLK